MADVDETDPDAGYATQTAPWFTQQPSGTAGLSTTPDDSNTNIVLNKIALDLGAQSGEVITALNAIAAAINAKPSA